MTASRSAPSRRCLFHVEHITCGRRPGCCGERNCADAFCADSLSLTRPSSAALGSTWNSETGLVGIRALPGRDPARRSPITVLDHGVLTTPLPAESAATRYTGLVCPPGRRRLVLTAGVGQGATSIAVNGTRPTHLRMRCCRLSGGTVDNAMNQLL